LDDQYTLNMRLVRGCNLMHALSVEHYCNMYPPDLNRKVHVDKIIFEILGTPGLYQRRVNALNLEINAKVNMQKMPIDQATVNTTIDDVVRRMAEAGVLTAFVDDAYEYAQQFALDVMAPLPPGWTAADAANILTYSHGYSAAPPSLFPNDNDVCFRSPYLPWQLEFENTVQFDTWQWRDPDMQGMRREPNSRIATAIMEGKGRQAPARRPGILDRHNPWAK
ncbi:hypothetical protein R3P38DRAFT_2403471, partial [Favolaschia claudopus]